MEKVLTFVKDQFYKIVMGVLAFLATGFLYGTYNNTKGYPEVQKNLNEFMTDQAENNKTYNGMLYRINLKLHDDSIRNEKQIR